MGKQCLMFMLLLTTPMAVTQELYLDEKTMPHFYVIVNHIHGSYTRVISWWENNASCLCYCWPHPRQLHKSHILMGKQCLMFMLLLDVAVITLNYLLSNWQFRVFLLWRPDTSGLWKQWETVPHVYVIVSRIYSSYTRVIHVSWWENNASCLCYC